MENIIKLIKYSTKDSRIFVKHVEIKVIIQKMEKKRYEMLIFVQLDTNIYKWNLSSRAS